jgi:DNA-binding response OmpR family regulator
MEGHRVLLAHNGHEALAQARAERPDLVLLDVMMPGMDGWEVLTQLKGDDDVALSELPVLMLTARSTDEDRVRGGIEGAIRYLTKPFLPAQLVGEVADALAGEPEPVKRRAAQREALSQLARLEKGSPAVGGSNVVRPHLTRLERTPEPDAEPQRVRAIREKLGELSSKQRELLTVLRAAPSVSQAAVELDVSRSNVYASLRRISRKLGTQSVPELLALVREGDLLRDLSA